MALNFSIIIPHKNIPLLLQRCLDSIPNREDIYQWLDYIRASAFRQTFIKA